MEDIIVKTYANQSTVTLHGDVTNDNLKRLGMIYDEVKKTAPCVARVSRKAVNRFVEEQELEISMEHVIEGDQFEVLGIKFKVLATADDRIKDSQGKAVGIDLEHISRYEYITGNHYYPDVSVVNAKTAFVEMMKEVYCTVTGNKLEYR
ncbi:hypothetical protein [Ligilactobacillus equi]|uniref:Uncharacterized protein n=1 Tax=Ligilactobacillus equi DSM 15833 = JCM 10991 TaxID=1423740 RepID=A0A0R1TMP7_9LACO|nr:hypothetical protein [Ligilactobacillus equi]KRL79733.1 hypothetical protein FC36_GL000362 [Ligilactobacillus equi DSM 15833 = JCM 10991]